MFSTVKTSPVKNFRYVEQQIKQKLTYLKLLPPPLFESGAALYYWDVPKSVYHWWLKNVFPT